MTDDSKKLKERLWNDYHSAVVVRGDNHRYWFEVVFKGAYKAGVKDGKYEAECANQIEDPETNPDTRRMMRFEAANAAMHALMRAEPDENELYTDRKKMDMYARYAVEYADALLDELDRTAKRKKK